MRPAVNVGFPFRAWAAARSALQYAPFRGNSASISRNTGNSPFSRSSAPIWTPKRQKILSRGAKLTDTLKQRQYLNYSVREMFVLLLVSQSDVIDAVPEKKVTAYNENLLDFIRVNRPEILSDIDPDQKPGDELKERILEVARECLSYVGIAVRKESTEAENG